MLASGDVRTVASRAEGFASIDHHLLFIGRQRASDDLQKPELQAPRKLLDPEAVGDDAKSWASENQTGNHVCLLGPVGPAESDGENCAAHCGSFPHDCGGA